MVTVGYPIPLRARLKVVMTESYRAAGKIGGAEGPETYNSGTDSSGRKSTAERQMVRHSANGWGRLAEPIVRHPCIVDDVRGRTVRLGSRAVAARGSGSGDDGSRRWSATGCDVARVEWWRAEPWQWLG
ncbi:hypothetical protein GCM10020218_025220 [Dactylosporangium vinaceum]